jgi:hypothetical protein
MRIRIKDETETDHKGSVNSKGAKEWIPDSMSDNRYYVN